MKRTIAMIVMAMFVLTQTGASYALRPAAGEKAAATGLSELRDPAQTISTKGTEIATILGFKDIAPKTIHGTSFSLTAVYWSETERKAVAIYEAPLPLSASGASSTEIAVDKDGIIDGPFMSNSKKGLYYSGAYVDGVKQSDYKRVYTTEAASEIVTTLSATPAPAAGREAAMSGAAGKPYSILKAAQEIKKFYPYELSVKRADGVATYNRIHPLFSKAVSEIAAEIREMIGQDSTDNTIMFYRDAKRDIVIVRNVSEAELKAAREKIKNGVAVVITLEGVLDTNRMPEIQQQLRPFGSEFKEIAAVSVNSAVEDIAKLREEGKTIVVVLNDTGNLLSEAVMLGAGNVEIVDISGKTPREIAKLAEQAV